ncbi:MAG: hypothetical protein A2033_18720 [Bacteroidetes bacterium GWA2_31_9]|nr:MAG: hypothetical protein A2033_18720 [Bacteroidetes bacterium GWA2_31_9]
MFRTLLKYFIFLAFFIPLISFSQTYNIKRFNVEDGLAQSQVLSIFQDKLGNLWIGTNGGGVSIYNGKDFKTISKDDGLVNNVVYSIAEDDKGIKYFGTNEGFSVYNGWNFKNFTETQGLSNNRVWKVINDDKGRIWLATGKGVMIYSNNKLEKVDLDTLLNKSTVTNILYQNEDNIWFGTMKMGLYLKNKNKIIRYNTGNGLSNNYILSINVDKNNIVWIGTNDGVDYIKDGKIYKTSSDKGSMAVVPSKISDEVFLASSGGHLFNNHFITDSKSDLGLRVRVDSKLKIWSMMEDNEGSIWFGSFDGSGLIKFPIRTFMNFNSEKDSILNSNVYSILEYPNDTFYIGSMILGISAINYKKSKISKVKELQYDYFAGQTITSIINDKENNIWFSTYQSITYVNSKNYDDYVVYITPKAYEKAINTNFKGYNLEQIARFKKRKEHFKIIDYLPEYDEFKTYTILSDSKGIMWFGHWKGVLRFSGGKFEDFTNNFPELKGKEIFKIYEDRNKNIWFASTSGVYYYDNRTLRHLGKSEGFSDEVVVSIIQDKRGNYWLGTKQGLFRFDENYFIKFSKENTDLINKEKGLSSNNIYSLIIDDNDNLFIASDKGIDKFNIKLYNTSRKIDITNYGQLEGFMGQECNLNACYKDHKGRLWFGTVGGATVYDPRFDIKNTVKPITQINSLHLAYKEFDWSPYSNGVDSLTKLPKELVLPYNKNHLTFEFVAASLAIPEKVKYQYLLEGLTNEWSPPRTKSEADFPSLPDGDYIFKVKACNNDGVWNEIPTEFHFTIKPPFWKTWWFYTILTILTLILFFLYVKWREAKLKQDKAILEQTVLERTEEVVKQKELVEQKNKDITDSINYARNIQEAVLVNIIEIKKCFNESFVLFRPRDIVSGDFYWFSHRGEFAYIAAADCTGHGVPGAFMSMLGMAFLNEIVNNNDYVTPNEILNSLRENVIYSLHQTGKAGESKDGMDLALAMVNLNNNDMQFSGANNPLYIIRKIENYNSIDFENSESRLQFLEADNAVLIEIKPDKMPIGYYIKDNLFSNNYMQLKPSDRIYLFSDGYADQFGGPKGKKFKYTQLKDIFLLTNNLNMDDQREFLDKTIIEWRGEHEQIDDILIVGISID